MGNLIRFGTDGWRACVGSEFNETNVARVAEALGRIWEGRNPGSVVYVGFDSEGPAHEFAQHAAGSLAAYNLRIKLFELPAPTPALGWTINQDEQCCGGIMITASSRRRETLCLKVRLSDGAISNEDFTKELEIEIAPQPHGLQDSYEVVRAVPAYLDSLLQMVDASVIRAAHLRVVHDSMYGASAPYVQQLLESMGVECIPIHNPSSLDREELEPDPVEPWVDECEQVVVATKASAGFVNDGDGDRVGAVDEHGRFVSPQKIVALLMGHLAINKNLAGRVVLSSSSSIQAKRVAQKLGLPVRITTIGFTQIHKIVRAGGVLIAGEESGGICIPAHMTERDGLLVHLLLCELMAISGKTLGQLVEELDEHTGKVCYARRDVESSPARIESLRNVLPGLNPADINGLEPVDVSHRDGMWLEFADESWLLVRISGTKDIVRVYAEAPTVEKRDALLKAGIDIAKGNN